jgi:hypothetical protein
MQDGEAAINDTTVPNRGLSQVPLNGCALRAALARFSTNNHNLYIDYCPMGAQASDACGVMLLDNRA